MVITFRSLAKLLSGGLLLAGTGLSLVVLFQPLGGRAADPATLSPEPAPSPVPAVSAPASASGEDASSTPAGRCLLARSMREGTGGDARHEAGLTDLDRITVMTDDAGVVRFFRDGIEVTDAAEQARLAAIAARHLERLVAVSTRTASRTL